MRFPRRAAVVGLVATLALGACSSTPPATGGAATTPQSGGTLTIAYPADPGCWDFQRAQGATLVPIQRNLFDGLVYQAADGSFVPWLAQSWTISDDGKSYTFTLRQDVTFSDGTKLDAAAVKTSLDRLTSKTTASTSYAGNFPYADSVVVDDDTVRVDLTQPHAAFLQVLSSPGGAIISPASAALDVDTLCEGGPDKLIGSGPYVVKDYVPNEYITLDRNPNYAWPPQTAQHTGPAYLDEITFDFFAETSVRFGALTSGQADYAYNIDATDYNAISDDDYVRLSKLNAGSSDLLMLNTDRAPFNDPAVRKALLRGIDLTPIINTIYQNTNQRAWSILTPPTPYYDASLENSWPYDASLANATLDADGWTTRDSAGYRTRDGVRLSARWLINGGTTGSGTGGVDDPLAEAIKEAAQKLGIEIVLDIVDTGTFTTRTRAADYEIVKTGTNRAEPAILGSNLFSSWSLPEDRLNNYSRVQDPQVDQWLSAAATTTDDAVRQENYSQVQHWVIDNAVAIPLQSRAWLGATSKRVHDVTQDIVGFPEFLYDTWVEQA